MIPTCIDERATFRAKCAISKPGNAAIWCSQIHLRPTTRPPPSTPSTTSTLSHVSSSLLPPITTLRCFPPRRTMEGRLDDAAFDRSISKKKIKDAKRGYRDLVNQVHYFLARSCNVTCRRCRIRTRGNRRRDETIVKCTDNANKGIRQRRKKMGTKRRKESVLGRNIGRHRMETCLSSCGRSRCYGSRISGGRSYTVDLASLRTVLRDVAHLAASIAGFASFAVHGATVWRGAIPGDMAKLAASVALHRLGLAIAGEMVWSAALVASCRARIAGGVASSHAATAAV